MPGLADDDVMTAVVTHWKADAALAADVPAGPKAGRLPSPTPLPYCHLRVERAKEPEHAGGGYYFDYRRVTLTVYGVKAAAVTILGHVARAFENGYPGGPASKELVVPNATWMTTLVEEPGRLEEDPTQPSGDDVWKAIAVYVVTCQRASA